MSGLPLFCVEKKGEKWYSRKYKSMPVRGFYRMKEKMRSLLCRPGVILLLAAELLVVGFAVAAALRPAAEYTFAADQWESIAQSSVIGYDEDGRIGVTEMTDGDDILQTPVRALPKGHYKVTVDYRYIPGRLESGREHHSCLYLKSEEPLTVTGEEAALNIDRQQDTVVLNVRQHSDYVRLVAHNDGGIFTLGTVCIRQDMLYAWTCVLGWVLCFAALDVLALAFAKAARSTEAEPKKKMACLLALLAITLLTFWPMLTDGGGLGGHDWVFHLSRIEGIADGLREGQFPVRIYTQAKDGYGYASSMFYGEILLYFPAVLRLLGVSVQQAYHMYAFAVLFLTAYVAFYALRQIFGSRKVALVGSALYMLAPYHLHNIYTRMAVGEYAAQAFLLLIPAALCLLYGTEKPTKQQASKAWWQLALAFTMLLQTHLLTLELVTLLAALFCLCNLRRTFTKQVFATWAAAAGTVVALNGWFLVPLLTLMLGGGYDILNGLDHVGVLHLQSCGYDLTELLGVDKEGKGVGVALLIGVLLFLLCLLAGKEMTDRERRLGKWSAAIGALNCFMSMKFFPWSELEHLPVVGDMLLKIQFPYRCLSIGIPTLVLAAGCGLSYLQRCKPAGELPAAALMLAAALAGTLLFYSVWLPSQSGQYFGDAGELIYANEATNVGWYYDGLYLPSEITQTWDGFAEGEPITTVAVESITQEKGVTALTCTETTGQDQHAELPLVYYPGYTVIEGAGTTFKTVNGLVGVTVPANYSGTIRVAFREPRRWLLADGVSVVTAVALAVLALRKRKHKKVHPERG